MNESRTWKRVLVAMKDLVGSCNMHFTENEGLRFQAMDGSHVCLVALELDADGFDSFSCPRSITIGIDIATLMKVLNCAGDDDKVTVSTNKNCDHLSVVFETKQNQLKRFTVALMNIDADELKIPPSLYPCVFSMVSKKVQESVRQLISFANEGTMSIVVAGDLVSFHSKADHGSGDIQSDEVEFEVRKADINLDFSSKYLSHFCKAAALSERVTFYMSPELPLKVEYVIEGKGSLSFYLTPKITLDEETSQ